MIPEAEHWAAVKRDGEARTVQGREDYGTSSVKANPLEGLAETRDELLDALNRLEWARQHIARGPQSQERIFVSGPLAGPDWEAVEQNIIAANSMFHRLWRMGHWPFCPHRGVTPDMVLEQAPQERRAWLDWCIRGWLPLCHSILMLPGWEDSPGAIAEHEAAQKLKLVVYYSLDEAPDLSES